MKHWIGELIGVNLRELEQARLSGTFPFPAALINRLIVEHLPSDSPLAAAVVEIHDDGELTANLRLRTPLVPPVAVQARIEQQPDLANAAPLVLRWSIDGLGAVTPLIALFVGRLSKLPPWLRIDGDQLEVDVGGLIEARGFGEIVPYCTSLHVSTRQGNVVLDFELRT